MRSFLRAHKCVWGFVAAAAFSAGLVGQVLPTTGTVTTIGGAFAGYTEGDNLRSQFNNPWGLTVGGDGRLYIADHGNNAIRVLNPFDNRVSTFTTTEVRGPMGVAFTSEGHLLVVNNTSGTVRRYSPTGTHLGLFAGGLASPRAIAVDLEGRVYVALATSVRQYNPGGGLTATFNLTAPADIQGLVVRLDGSILVSDARNHVIWRFSPAGGAATVFAGTQGSPGFANGAVGEARFNQPHQIAPALNNSIIVADRMNHRVRVVDFNGYVNTLYGADPVEWADVPEQFLPGWDDGASSSAWVREPVGVVATSDGTVYGSEVYFDIIRKVASVSYPTNSGGGNNGSLPGGPRNVISLGFPGGEASSAFRAAPGQRFSAPIVLSVLPGQKMYGLQFSTTITNLTGPAPAPWDPYAPAFQSFLAMPTTNDYYTPIPPAAAVSVTPVVTYETVIVGGLPVQIPRTNVVADLQSLVFGNEFGNFLGIAWLERRGQTNLYPTPSQDLITYSGAHDTLFLSANGSVVVGGFSFNVPDNAAIGDTYLISVERPSANSDGVAADVYITNPDRRSAQTPVLSAFRILRIDAAIPYLVGDVAPFRWFNAGDFGDWSLLNNDLVQLQQTFVYYLNSPPPDSDMWDALDSCCLDVNGAPVDGGTFRDVGRDTINRVALGDGMLDLRDLYVSERRSLDGSLSNYIRFWQGGVRQALPTNNVFRGNMAVAPAAAPEKKFTANETMAELPSGARFFVENARLTAGQFARLPLKVEVTGGVPVKSLLTRFTVVGLDGVAANVAVSFTGSAELPAPSVNLSKSGSDRSVAWLETLPELPAGTFTLGTIDFLVPANANADCIFDVRFSHVQSSIGLTAVPAVPEHAVLIMNNRAAAPWNDEIPDAWRVQHFGSLMNVLSAAEADADGDGMSNLEEFRAGTIPTDNASRLALAGRAARGAFVLSWPTSASKFYRLQVSSELTGASWITLEERISGTGSIVERTPAVPNPERAFYRVQVVE